MYTLTHFEKQMIYLLQNLDDEFMPMISDFGRCLAVVITNFFNNASPNRNKILEPIEFYELYLEAVMHLEICKKLGLENYKKIGLDDFEQVKKVLSYGYKLSVLEPNIIAFIALIYGQNVGKDMQKFNDEKNAAKMRIKQTQSRLGIPTELVSFMK